MKAVTSRTYLNYLRNIIDMIDQETYKANKKWLLNALDRGILTLANNMDQTETTQMIEQNKEMRFWNKEIPLHVGVNKWIRNEFL